MSLANNILILFMILLTVETITEYFFFWEAFEKKFGKEFTGFPWQFRILRNFVMFFYALLCQAMKLVGTLLIFTSLLMAYVYGPLLIKYLELLCVYYCMRLRAFVRNNL